MNSRGPQQFQGATVIIIIMIATIAAESLLAVWSASLAHAGTPINNSLEPLLGWSLIGLAVIAVVALFGPRHEQIWSFVLLVFFGTLVLSFLMSQIAVGLYSYRREYTSLPTESLPLHFTLANLSRKA